MHPGRRRGVPLTLSPLLIGIVASLLAYAASRCYVDAMFSGRRRPTHAARAHRHLQQKNDADAIDADLDCGMRRLFLEMAGKALPWRTSTKDVFDALELGIRCHDVYADDVPPGTADGGRATAVDDEAGHAFHVSPTAGNDRSAGNQTHPFRTIHRAVEATRALARKDTSQATTLQKVIILHPGIHFLTETLVLAPPLDSNLTIRSASTNPDDAPTAWISGGVLIDSKAADWKPSHANDNIWVADLSSIVDDSIESITGLFTVNPHQRMTLARYPNADVEEWNARERYVPSINHRSNATDAYEWHFPRPSNVPEFYSIDLSQPNNPTGHIKNDSSMAEYNMFGTGTGGACAQVWGDAPSYWCGNVSAGGWAEVDRAAAEAGRPNIPVGLTVHDATLAHRFRRWDAERARGAVFHVQHTQGWAWHMFNVSHIDDAAPTNWTAHFDKGGSQGGRNFQCYDEDTNGLSDCNGPTKKLRSGTWYVEGVLEELDAEREFYYDSQKKLLYFYPDHTWCDRMSTIQRGLGGKHRAKSTHCIPDLIATNLKTLIQMQGSMDDPLQSVQLRGIGLRDSAKTYTEQWGVPSGGDWALHRGGALHFEGTENVTISDCHFTRLDGNAIMLSSYNRHTRVARSEFSWIGNGAMATWGDTERGYDATGGAQPRHSIIENNIISNIGLYQKQSSAWGQNKACQNIIRNNVIFDVPRAAINFNDGLGGGNLIQGNVMFNTCRESGDHGAINSWDRMPFLIDSEDGPPFTPQPTHTVGNLIMANYNAAQGFDNDDGSSWYYTHDNVFYDAEGFKMDYGGHSSSFKRNLVYGKGCYGTGGFLNKQLADAFEQNTCIIDEDDPTKEITIGHLFQCSLDGMVPAKNAYYTTNGNGTVICGNEHRTLDDIQKEGYEVGSTLMETPDAETITAWAREILNQPTHRGHASRASEEKKEKDSVLFAWIICSVSLCVILAWCITWSRKNHYWDRIYWYCRRSRAQSGGDASEPFLEYEYLETNVT